MSVFLIHFSFFNIKAWNGNGMLLVSFFPVSGFSYLFFFFCISLFFFLFVCVCVFFFVRKTALYT